MVAPGKTNPFAPELRKGFLILCQQTEDDYDRLYSLASDPILWENHNDRLRYTREGFDRYFSKAMENPLGSYLICEGHRQELRGATRFYDFVPEEARVSIGFTFIARAYWGSGLNDRVKQIMLQHAFDHVETVRFDVFEKNHRSQKAVEKLGARLTETKESMWVYTLDSHHFFKSL